MDSKAWTFAAAAVAVAVVGCADGSPAPLGTTSGLAEDPEMGTTTWEVVDDGDSAGEPPPALTSGAPVDETGDPSDPVDCVPGVEQCVCLEGSCVGGLTCLEGICLQGPTAEFGFPDYKALPGMRRSVTYDVVATEYWWEQVGGPPVVFVDPSARPLQVDIPGDSEVTPVELRFHATRNGVDLAYDLSIELLPVDVQATFDDPQSVPAVGPAGGVGFTSGGLWMSSPTQGSVAMVSTGGDIVDQFDVGGAPTRLYPAAFPGDAVAQILFFTDPIQGALRVLYRGNGLTETVAESIPGIGTVGPAADVIRVGGGDAVFSTGNGGRVFYFDYDPDTATSSTHVLVDQTQIGADPTALAFANGVVYVGTRGEVWRVSIEDKQASESELYAALDDPSPAAIVDGLLLDRDGNLFAAMSGQHALHVIHETSDAASPSTWSWALGSDAGVEGLRSGVGQFGATSIFFVNGDGGVSSIEVGTKEVPAPY